MRFWLKVCALFFVSGVGSLLFGLANKAFDLGIWHEGAYPPTTTENGVTQGSTFWTFMAYAGGIALAAAILGTWLMGRLERRAIEAEVLLEMLHERAAEEESEQ